LGLSSVIFSAKSSALVKGKTVISSLTVSANERGASPTIQTFESFAFEVAETVTFSLFFL